MKKMHFIFFLTFVFSSLVFTSCGNGKSGNNDSESDTLTVLDVDSPMTDTTGITEADSLVKDTSVVNEPDAGKVENKEMNGDDQQNTSGDKQQPVKEMGTVKGQVWFTGVPCKQGSSDYRVPPCDGPYAGYEVVINFRHGGKKPAATVKADENGRFSASLNPGDYIIYAQNGPEVSNRKAYEFTVTAGKAAEVNIRVSTGIQ